MRDGGMMNTALMMWDVLDIDDSLLRFLSLSLPSFFFFFWMETIMNRTHERIKRQTTKRHDMTLRWNEIFETGQRKVDQQTE